MKIELKHDPEADAAYFTLSEGEMADFEESSPGRVWDFDENNQVVRVEILNLKYRTPEEFIHLAKASEFYLTEEQKIAFRDFFSKTPAHFTLLTLHRAQVSDRVALANTMRSLVQDCSFLPMESSDFVTGGQDGDLRLQK